uniref:HORMA domain containing 1 n=1 Tax=Acanthochromis polyacanthus TaxID=80966 RepID=A0A3Q1GPG0_9TELE
MACAQQVRTSQDAQLCPNQVVSEQQSLVVIKKLLAIAVSGITYLRGIFPGRAYGTRNVEEDAADCFKNSSRMQGCFDAIQKKYVSHIPLFSHSQKICNKVTEFYQFRIQYTEKGAQMDFERWDSLMLDSCTKKACILLVRKLYTLMQNLNPLPDVVSLNMRLAYYDDVTPHDYQPPGFREADGDTMEFEQEPVKLTMGEVVTPFHGMRLDMVTEKRRLEQVNEKEASKRGIVLVIGEQVKIFVSSTSFTMDTLVKRTSNMEVGFKRTRSGRIIKSTTVSQPFKTQLQLSKFYL